MILDTLKMMKEVAYKSNGNSDVTSLATDDQNILISDLDQAHNKICDIILNMNPLILSHYYDLTLDGSQRYYLADSIDFHFDHEQILMVTDISGGGTSPLRTMATAWRDRMNYYDNYLIPWNEPWNINNGYIEFPHQPTGTVIRIWYTRRPTGLFYGTTTTGTTTTAAITTATAGEIVLENDYYNGMKITKGTQVRRITDSSFSSTTVTLTVTPAWTTAPTTTEISLMSPLPERYHQLIVDEAIRRQKVGNDDDDFLVARLLDQDISVMKSRVGKLQSQQPEGIRHMGWE